MHCDNESGVYILRKKSCAYKNAAVLVVVRFICSLAVRHQFYFWIKHIRTEENVIADALSRKLPQPTKMKQRSVGDLIIPFTPSFVLCVT